MCSDREAVIGKILAPHGVAGMVRVFPYTDYPERIKLLEEIELLRDSQRRVLAVEKSVLHGRYWLIKFAGIETRDDACLLVESLLVIPLGERLPLDDDSFYHDQLVGLTVYGGDDTVIGIVVDIIATGGHDLLVVEKSGEEEKRTLIPAVKRFVKRLDVAEGAMFVDLPEGLLDL